MAIAAMTERLDGEGTINTVFEKIHEFSDEMLGLG